jgi:hypothetical protein
MAQQEKSHDGLAVLSMHQPWASLLVHGALSAPAPFPAPSRHLTVRHHGGGHDARSSAGIKRMEGRTWPTSHRGRLWIHATSVKPSEEDIQVCSLSRSVTSASGGH